MDWNLGVVSTFHVVVKDWTIPMAVGFYNTTGYTEFRQTGRNDVIWEFLDFVGEKQPTTKRKPKWEIAFHDKDNPCNKFILQSLLRHGQTVRPTPKLSQILWVDKNILFTDAWSVLPLRLESLEKAFKDEIYKEIYISKSAQTSYSTEKWCLVLSKVLTAWAFKLLEEFGTTPKSTLSLTAANVFDKRFFPLERIESNLKFEEYIRGATYGGRNEIYRKYGENIHFYDINSMYVSCYDTPVPVGELQQIRPNIDKGTLAYAKVNVPKDFPFGPLPYVHQKQLIFPVGEFEGWWDIVELRNAAKLGIDLTLVHQFEADEEPVMEGFGRAVCDLKLSSNRYMAKIWKQFGIDLYGKLGQRLPQVDIKPAEEMTDDDHDFATPILEADEAFYMVPRKSGKNPNKKPAISMRIRAEARVRHLSYLLEAHKKGPVYYCDTDSVICSAELPVSEEPGQLKETDFALRAYFIMQKFYAYINLKRRLIQRTSGYSGRTLREEDFITLINKGEIEINDFQFTSWRALLGEGRIERLPRAGTVSGDIPPRNRELMGDETVPITLPRPAGLEVYEAAFKED